MKEKIDAINQQPGPIGGKDWRDTWTSFDLIAAQTSPLFLITQSSDWDQVTCLMSGTYSHRNSGEI